MLHRIAEVGLKFKVGAIALLLAAGALALLQVAPAEAHCDSVNGPVVNAARQALAARDVKLVLPYVKPEYEAELSAAFDQALRVRKMGPQAQELADTYFFETAVRLHRTGEGASYTGLKYETDFGPALEAADQALETGSLDGVYSVLDQATREGIAQRYQAVQAARAEATRLGTVEAQRERAEAELIFEKYVYELHQAALGQAPAAEGGTGHAHGAATAQAQGETALAAHTEPAVFTSGELNAYVRGLLK